MFVLSERENSMKVMKRVLLVMLYFVSISTQAQVCDVNTIKATTPNDRYIVHTNGTVTDVAYGLMWTQCSLGQTETDGRCLGDATNYTWQQALQAVQTANQIALHGYANWRLPNQKELGSIVERQCHSPAINLNIFPDTPGVTYFSSTPDSRDPAKVRVIYFVDGSEFPPDVSIERKVRMVRYANQ